MGSVSIVLPYDDRWYFAEALRGALGRIQESGHEAVVHVIPPSATSTAQARAAVDEDFVDPDAIGGIVIGFRYQGEQLEQRQRDVAPPRPLVLVGGSVLGYPTVMIDDSGGAFTATDHLRRLGHSRIVHLAGVMFDQMDFSVHARRARGYLRAMEQAGLEPLIIETEFDPDAAYAAARALLEGRNPPTAIFAVSDEIAFPVLAAARDLGLRPGRDLSVAGFDDHPRAEAEDLTTIRQRPDEQGAAAADLLLGGIGRGPDPHQSRLMGVSLVTRGSSGPPWS
jgi:DNA-binding LacI/PurR family transcriptional regulator